MATKLTKDLTRQTNLIDHVSLQPWLIILKDCGRTIELRPKGRRYTLRIPLSEVIVHAGRLAATELRRQRKEATASRSLF